MAGPVWLSDLVALFPKMLSAPSHSGILDFPLPFFAADGINQSFNRAAPF